MKFTCLTCKKVDEFADDQMELIDPDPDNPINLCVDCLELTPQERLKVQFFAERIEEIKAIKNMPLNDWNKQFLDSISKQMRLSNRQQEVFNKMKAKYESYQRRRQAMNRVLDNLQLGR